MNRHFVGGPQLFAFQGFTGSPEKHISSFFEGSVSVDFRHFCKEFIPLVNHSASKEFGFDGPVSPRFG